MPPRREPPRQPAARAHRAARQIGANADRAPNPDPQEGQADAALPVRQVIPPGPQRGRGGRAAANRNPAEERDQADNAQDEGANPDAANPLDGADAGNQNIQNLNPIGNPIQPAQRQQRTVMVSMAAAPITADSPVFLRANDPLVLATPFLGWNNVQGAPARVSLASFQMFRVFASRCRVGQSDNDRETADALSILQVRLSEDAWSRILSCLVDNGLLALQAENFPAFSKMISELDIADATQLEISADDWVAGEIFAIPQDQAALSIALQPLAYLSYVTVSLLEGDIQLKLPWENLCYLTGALGPCLTQRSRGQATSSVQLVAQKLRAFLGGTAISDGAAARGLCDALPDLKLPTIFKSTSVREADLRLELLDAIQYHTASESGRATIETRRVSLLGPR